MSRRDAFWLSSPEPASRVAIWLWRSRPWAGSQQRDGRRADRRRGHHRSRRRRRVISGQASGRSRRLSRARPRLSRDCRERRRQARYLRRPRAPRARGRASAAPAALRSSRSSSTAPTACASSDSTAWLAPTRRPGFPISTSMPPTCSRQGPAARGRRHRSVAGPPQPFQREILRGHRRHQRPRLPLQRAGQHQSRPTSSCRAAPSRSARSRPSSATVSAGRSARDGDVVHPARAARHRPLRDADPFRRRGARVPPERLARRLPGQCRPPLHHRHHAHRL